MSIIYSPPNMIKKYCLVIADCFNSITLKDVDGNDKIIPIRLGTTQKIFSMSQIIDETRNAYRYTLPLMGFSLNSLSFDSARTQSKLNTIRSTDLVEKIRQPTPYNFAFELNILASKASQIYEIIEMILPTYQQARYYPLIEYKFTDGSTIKRDVPILLESNNIDIKSDVAGDEEQMFAATLTFTIQGYLHHAFIESGAKAIENIDINYEQYVEGQYSKLVATQELDVQTGNTISETLTDPA